MTEKNLVVLIVSGFLLLILSFLSIGTVGAGERGVLLNWGAVQEEIKQEGIYLKIPFMQSVKNIDIKTQKVETTTGAASKDLQIVTTTIALNYHPEASSVNKLYQEVGVEYNDRIISPAVQEAVKATTAQFTAEELITRREEVKSEIKQNLIDRLSERHIVVEELNITNLDFSRSFNDAIEAKVTAEQNKLKAETELKIKEIEKDQAIVEAQGKAEAIKIEAEALKSNAQVAELRWIEKWNGEVPQYWGSANAFIGLNQ